ncbi:MAG: ATP-binding protein [Polyangia bacterium]
MPRKRIAALKPPKPAAVMTAAFELARELSLDLREEELVGTFASALAKLLPGRRLCLRVIDPRLLSLTSLVANGPVPERLREAPLVVKRSALRQTRLPDAITLSGRVVVSDAYESVFPQSTARGGGFSVPLVASAELFGLLNVEYPDETQLAISDERVVIPLANQLSVALRNLDLLGEARYYRDYLRKLIDVANALIVVIDRDGRIAVMNVAMQSYLGIGPDVIGTPLAEPTRSGGEPRLGALLLDGLSGREHSDREVMIARSDGAQHRALFNTSVLRASDGQVDGVIAIGQDVERMRSLERQVIQAEKLATLGQLAAGVVHELNNPLTSISVYGEFIVRQLEKGLPADLERARKVVEGAARIHKLTKDLISYARPSGEWEQASVNDVVRTALVFCEHVLHRAEAQVGTELSVDLPSVRAIPTQLHQVLINLVTNACHALPAPGEHIRVRTSLVGSVVQVEVIDSGVGIEATDLPHIFDPFFTTKKDGKGTGLGLSIVKNIIEAHRGSIHVVSTPGEGTCFRILLPASV